MEQPEQKASQKKFRCKANVDYGGKAFQKDQIYLESDLATVPPDKRFKFEPLEIVTIQADFERMVEQTDDEKINQIVQLNKSVSSLAIDNDAKDKEIKRLGDVVTEKNIEIARKSEDIRNLEIRIRELKNQIAEMPPAKQTKKQTKK